jgi:aconitase A
VPQDDVVLTCSVHCTNNSEVRDIIAADMLTESARSANLAVDEDFVDQFAPWAPACTCQ